MERSRRDNNTALLEILGETPAPPLSLQENSPRGNSPQLTRNRSKTESHLSLPTKSVLIDECDDVEIADEASTPAPTEAKADSPGSISPTEQESFEDVARKVTLRIPVVVNGELPLSLDEFQRLFVHDEAPFGWMQYHQRVKDTNIVATQWIQLTESDCQWRREIKFFKPVNLPGLKSTRGVKLQSLRTFQDKGRTP